MPTGTLEILMVVTGDVDDIDAFIAEAAKTLGQFNLTVSDSRVLSRDQDE